MQKLSAVSPKSRQWRDEELSVERRWGSGKYARVIADVSPSYIHRVAPLATTEDNGTARVPARHNKGESNKKCSADMIVNRSELGRDLRGWVSDKFFLSSPCTQSHHPEPERR